MDEKKNDIYCTSHIEGVEKEMLEVLILSRDRIAANLQSRCWLCLGRALYVIMATADTQQKPTF